MCGAQAPEVSGGQGFEAVRKIHVGKIMILPSDVDGLQLLIQLASLAMPYGLSTAFGLQAKHGDFYVKMQHLDYNFDCNLLLI